MLESLFNSEYCKTCKSTYFEDDLRMAVSENVFIKRRKIKTYKEFLFYIKKHVFTTSVSEASENVCFYIMIGFL